MSSKTTKELEGMAIGGDVSAFEELILPYQKKVYNIALNYTNHHEDALELTQEVLLKAFRYIKTFKGEASFSTWLFRVATNTCIDHYRKIRTTNYLYRDQNIQYEEGAANSYEEGSFLLEPSTMVLKKERREKLRDALNKIPIDLKTVIVFREIHGFSYDEIAQIIGVPLGTIKSRISRARQLLKEILWKDKETFYQSEVQK